MSWRPAVYRCGLDPQWIDYNGHLRDAYYTLVFSQAIDALMDEISVSARALGVDAKRLHLGLAMHCPRHDAPAALAEFMLLHVQRAPSPKSAPLPPEVLLRLAAWHASDSQAPAPIRGSRKMEIVRR